MLFTAEQVVVQIDSRRDHVRHPSFYETLHRFGIFKLVYDGYPVAAFDQFWQIGLQCMVRETRQRHFRSRSIGAFCENNVQCF